MFFVYILCSKTLQKFYVGSTNNVNDRIHRHNTKQGKFTSTGVPWDLIWYKELESRPEAVRLEIKIKKRGISRFLIDNDIVFSNKGR